MHEHHAIVPNADRSALLVADGHLPVVHTAERQQVPTMTALMETYRVPSPFLRTVRRVEDEDKHLTTLFEVDAVEEGWEPVASADWLPLKAIDPTTVAPRFPDGLEEWLAEERDGVPLQRAPWARPGWLARATAWVDEAAGLQGQPRLVRQWPLSSMYAFETGLGNLYLKACFAIWPQEPAVTAALARKHPGAVPDVVAVEEREAWLLMRELTGIPVADSPREAIEEQLRAAAQLQREWIGRGGELRALGAPHRPLAELGAAVPELSPLCERLGSLGIPETRTKRALELADRL